MEIKQTPEVHLPTCGKSGHLKCQDYLHNKTEWSEQELKELTKVLENYE